MQMQETATTETEVKPVTSSEENKSASAKTDETKEASDASDETLDADESENDESADGERPKKQNGFKKRIGKLTARLSEREQRIYDLERQLSQRAQVETPKETKSVDEGEPDPNDYETNAAYIKDLVKYNAKQEKLEIEKAKKEDEKTSTYKKQLDTHLGRVNEFKKSMPDYDDVISEFLEDHGDIKFSEAIEETLLTSDLSAEIVYHLAKNKPELDRINSLSPVAAARELGKLELKLSKESVSEQIEEKKTSKAPTPISPVKGKSGSGLEKSVYDNDIPFKEYEALRRKQIFSKRKA